MKHSIIKAGAILFMVLSLIFALFPTSNASSPTDEQSTQQHEKKTELHHTCYDVSSHNVDLQLDFDMDGKKDHFVLIKDDGEVPKLSLDMNENGAISMELTDYEYGGFKKIMCADITDDGRAEVLILADMGGNGAAGGLCTLYGFTKGDEWRAMSFPFLEDGAMGEEYRFEGSYDYADYGVMEVTCFPTDEFLAVINNDNLELQKGSYLSSGLTGIKLDGSGGNTYDLLLLQEMRGADDGKLAGNGITKVSCLGGNYDIISQKFNFSSQFDGIEYKDQGYVPLK